MIAAIYARKSNDEGDKDAEAKSVAPQVQRASEYAKKRGWAVDDRFVFTDDGISGAEFKKRPGLTKLIDTLSAPKFGALIISEQSRLGRDTIRIKASERSLASTSVTSLRRSCRSSRTGRLT